MNVGQNTASSVELRSFIERIERVRADKKQLGQDEAAIMAEAKASGFTPGAIRDVVKIRAMKPHDRQESEAMLDMYLHAMGMANEPPLFRAAGLAAVDTAVREQVIERMKDFVPPEGAGEIVVTMGGQSLRLVRNKDGDVREELVLEPAPKPAGGKQRAASPPRGEVPNVSEAGAEELGRQAARDNRPVIENPFPFGDARRARFDEGWRRETGSDGMGPED